MAEPTMKNWKPPWERGGSPLATTRAATKTAAAESKSTDGASGATPTMKGWKPPWERTSAANIQPVPAQSQEDGEDFQQKVGRFAGITGFEGEARTDDILKNAGMDLDELGESYKLIGNLISQDFKSGNYTKTLGMLVKNFPEAVVTSYTRWMDAHEKGILGEAIKKYPLQFAQDVSLPVTFLLGGSGAALKAAGATGRVAQAVKTMGKIANAVEIGTDPFVGIPSVGLQKLVGKAFRKSTGKTPQSPGEELPTSLEKESLQGVLEEKGYANAPQLADDVLNNPDLRKKDPDLNSAYDTAQKKLLPDEIDFDKAAQEILDLDLDTSPPSKKYIVNQNIRRLQTTHEMDNLTDAMATKLEKRREPVRTWERNDQLADMIGMSPEDLLKIKDRKALNSYQIEAARRINQQALLNLYSAKNIAKQAPNPENLIKFDHALRLYSATFDKMSGITTEAGRALQIFNKMPKLEKMKQKAVRELIDKHGGTRRIEETMSIMDELNDDQLSRFVRKSLEATNWDKFREAWMSALLSGPTTQAVNAGSTGLSTAYTQAFESLATSAYSEVANAVRRITGKNTTPVGFAETVGRVRGLGRGLIAGAQAFKKNFVDGDTFGIMLPIEYRRNAIGGKTGKVIRMPLKLLESTDSFYKALNYTSELEGLAVRKAIKEARSGVAGGAARKITKEEADFLIKNRVSSGKERVIDDVIGDDASLLSSDFGRGPSRIISDLKDKYPSVNWDQYKKSQGLRSGGKSDYLDMTGIKKKLFDIKASQADIKRFSSVSQEITKKRGDIIKEEQAARSVGSGTASKSISDRVKELVTKPTDDLVDAAMLTAEKNTFTNKLGGDGLTEVGKFLMAGKNNKYFGKPLQLVIPFVRTPTNIMKFALERTPMAPLFADVRQSIKAGGIARDQAMARIALGSALSFYVTNKVADGEITGALSSDRNKRNVQRASGMQPYSFKVGDNYFSYQRLEPLGTIVGITADFKQLYDLLSGPETEMNRKDIEKIPALISASISQNVLNKTYMQGLSGLVAAMEDPDRNFQRFYSSLASTVIPTAVAQYARAEDPYLREAKTVMEKIKNRIPRLRESLPYKFNVFGEPIKIETKASFINPIYQSTEKKDKVMDEMLRLGVYPSMPRDEITIGKQKIKLDKYQYETMLSYGRKQAKKMLDDYVSSPDWETRPDIDKKAIIDKVIRNYDRRARSLVYKIATRY